MRKRASGFWLCTCCCFFFLRCMCILVCVPIKIQRIFRNAASSNSFFNLTVPKNKWILFILCHFYYTFTQILVAHTLVPSAYHPELLQLEQIYEAPGNIEEPYLSICIFWLRKAPHLCCITTWIIRLSICRVTKGSLHTFILLIVID